MGCILVPQLLVVLKKKKVLYVIHHLQQEATLEKKHYSLHQCAVMISTAVCCGSVCIGVWMRETTPTPLLYSDGQFRDRDI